MQYMHSLNMADMHMHEARARTETCTYLGTGPGSRHGLGAQAEIRSLRIPAMASSQGDVRSSPMAYPAVRPLPKLPLL